MKRLSYLIIAVLCFVLAGVVIAQTGGPRNAYVLMALQQTTDTENNPIYTLVKGAVTFDVSATKGYTMAQSGSWRMVRFYLSEIKPDSMTLGAAADWLSQADGFLAFDFRMLGEYARAGSTIQNRTFDYDTVLDVVLVYEWWILEDDVYVRYSGNKAAYIAAGAPKLAKVMPMPHYLGVPNDTY